MAQRRTTHRSRKGTKLYAVRKADGTFDDIQTYKRAHAADLRKSAKAETSAKSQGAVAKRAAKATVKKAASAGSGLFARAKKAVGSMLRSPATKVTPAKRTAKKAAKKKTRKA